MSGLRIGHKSRRAANGKGIVKDLVQVVARGMNHECNFSLIMPRQMDKLVADGLFERHDGTYRITDKGRKFLATVENQSK